MYLALHHSCPRLAALLAGLAVLLPTGSQAAGGHHAVDDASTVDPGRCQMEVWMEHAPGRQLQHVGSACHALGMEIGLSLERSADRAVPTVRSTGLQLKWAREVEPGFSLGAVWAAGWQSGSPRFAGHTVLIPLSWSPREDLTLHVNAGRDFPSRGACVGHYGAALEWQPSGHWQALLEGWRDGLGPQRRIGLRYLFNDRLSVDVSRAQAMRSPGGRWSTLGLNWDFDR